MDNTLTVFTSDHGEALGEHEYYFDHGRFSFQSCLAVPLILHFPGVIPPGVEPNPVVRDDFQDRVFSSGLAANLFFTTAAIGAATSVLLFVMEWLYGGLMETFWNGQTIGKRVMGVRVVWRYSSSPSTTFFWPPSITSARATR